MSTILSNESDARTAQGTQVTATAVMENKVPATALDNPFWSNDSFASISDASQSWNASLPYRLVVVEAQSGGGYAQVPGWDFVLPIPPQEIGISMPFAINVSATMGGIVEEHGGAPFKLINLSGTTGVLPTRGNVNELAGGGIEGIVGKEAGAILSGLSANAFNRVWSTKQGVVAAVTGEKRNLQTVLPIGGGFVNKNQVNTAHTGFYQFKLLENFLERYAQIKRTQAGVNYRLCFCVYKEQAFYLVTPQTFDVQRSASSPLEYPFRLSFKAWKRIARPNIGGVAATQDIVKTGLSSPGGIGEIINRMTKARMEIENGVDALKSLVETMPMQLLEVTRQATLAAKMGAGIIAYTLDYTNEIQRTALSAEGSWKKVADEYGKLFSKTDAPPPPDDTTSTTGGLSGVASSSDKSKSTFIDWVLGKPELLNVIQPSRLSLDPHTLRLINAENRKAKGWTKNQYIEAREQLVQALVLVSNATGGGNTTFNETYNLNPAPALVTASDEETQAIQAINEFVLQLDKFIVTLDTANPPATNSMDYVAGLARQSGIAFIKPVSKFPVPFPYGGSLERLSLDYLKDANRWHEIAVLNGLRAPYIDEEGFDLSFRTDGDANTVTIEDTTSLYVRQKVTLFSDLKAPVSRRIVSLQRIPGQYVILGLDGDADLQKYIVADNARVHAFLPDTVNSQMVLYIPSNEEPPEGDKYLYTKSLPGVDEFDPLLEVGGIDLLLDDSGDIVITPDGDCKLAVGLTNIIQSVKLLLRTPKGSLLQHPNYGLGLEPGISVADISAKGLLTSLQSAFSNDPTFSGIENVGVSVRGPAIVISMTLRVRYTNHLVPVSFVVS